MNIKIFIHNHFFHIYLRKDNVKISKNAKTTFGINEI